MHNKLNVSEVFYSIQGEGMSCGVPAVFLRLGGCNLLCKWCDTVEVWKKSKATEFEDIIPEEFVFRLQAGAHLVITGGEPLLHEESIYNFITWFKDKYKFSPFVEMETNGTIVPDPIYSSCINQWNVSPKLANSGEPSEERINELAISILSRENSCFKFVVSDEKDLMEIIMDYLSIRGAEIERNQIYLMPCGENQQQLSVTRPIVAEMAKTLVWNFTDRMHISIWDKKTGV